MASGEPEESRRVQAIILGRRVGGLVGNHAGRGVGGIAATGVDAGDERGEGRVEPEADKAGAAAGRDGGDQVALFGACDGRRRR